MRGPGNRGVRVHGQGCGATGTGSPGLAPPRAEPTGPDSWGRGTSRSQGPPPWPLPLPGLHLPLPCFPPVPSGPPPGEYFSWGMEGEVSRVARPGMGAQLCWYSKITHTPLCHLDNCIRLHSHSHTGCDRATHTQLHKSPMATQSHAKSYMVTQSPIHTIIQLCTTTATQSHSHTWSHNHMHTQKPIPAITHNRTWPRSHMESHRVTHSHIVTLTCDTGPSTCTPTLSSLAFSICTPRPRGQLWRVERPHSSVNSHLHLGSLPGGQACSPCAHHTVSSHEGGTHQVTATCSWGPAGPVAWSVWGLAVESASTLNLPPPLNLFSHFYPLPRSPAGFSPSPGR